MIQKQMIQQLQENTQQLNKKWKSELEKQQI